jgi:membrane associated rhomboid family serine protease
VIPLQDDNPTRTFPLVTVLLIVANVLVFLYEVSLGSHTDTFIQSCAFIPAELVSGRDIPPPDCVQPPYLTILTSMFMHGGFLHIAGNMLYLWIFGNNVEESMGSFKYLLFYLFCGIVAALAQTFITLTFAPSTADIPNLGASGAIAGVLGAYLVLFPGARVKTLIILGIFLSMTWIPAIVVLGLWFVLQFLQGVGSLGAGEAQGGVAVWAHVGGFVTGMILVKLLANRERGRHVHPAYRF